MSAPVARRDTNQQRIRFAAIDLLVASGSLYRKEGEPAWRPLCVLASEAHSHGLEVDTIALALDMPTADVPDTIAAGYRFLA